jgi:GxxExxY protein
LRLGANYLFVDAEERNRTRNRRRLVQDSLRAGPGLLESVYETILARELAARSLNVTRQQPVPIVYDGIRIEIGFRADLVIEDLVVVEIKSVEHVLPVHKKQLLTYIRLMDRRLGLLVNFGAALIRDGITRMVNRLEE